jgi:hypothetical protein
MKRIVLTMFVLFGLLALGGAVWPPGGRAASTRDSAVVEFANTVKLGGVLLRGKYLIVHDEERMARGEACTYIYRGDQINEAKLVTSFHCIHVERETTPTLKITMTHRSSPYETPEVIEIQFAGSNEGHKVP